MTDTQKLTVATIIPGVKASGGGAHMATGTRVILSDGSELERVQAVTLRAEVGGAWAATIELLPDIAPAITANADVRELDVTTLADQSQKFVRIAYPGVDQIPVDGTFPLDPGEKVVIRQALE